MGNPVSGVNPKILVWARERAGLTTAQVAEKMSRSVEEVEAWESDPDAAPTYPQLEALAYRVYKRPVALFFFPEPPEEKDPEHSFRTLPDFEIEDLSADTRYKIRQAHALQLSLYELSGGTNPAPEKVFADLHVQTPTNAFTAGGSVRSRSPINSSSGSRHKAIEASSVERWQLDAWPQRPTLLQAPHDAVGRIR
jgi:transcriptional regulator with XRE-family HTH domain